MSGNSVTITKGKSSGKYRIIEVKAVIENSGALPTHTARGATYPGNREDVVWLVTDRKNVDFIEGATWRRIGVLGGTTSIPGIIPPEIIRLKSGGLLESKVMYLLKLLSPPKKGARLLKK
ncbi:MAG: hypothetical protein MZV63_14610 [Marinilabiliales bacterium]|nr:hypothetical protein [Marinilabiliales bacterium]